MVGREDPRGGVGLSVVGFLTEVLKMLMKCWPYYFTDTPICHSFELCS